jgi:hypothetical protein
VAGAVGGNGEERVRALYDYEGGEVEDLPVVENEVLSIIERGKSFFFFLLSGRMRKGKEDEN